MNPRGGVSPARNVMRGPGSFRTIQDVLVERLRETILSGQMKPGERIVERAVTQEWGISKTPVREALAHLEAEGWVRIIPHRGAVVTSLSVEELEDIYLIRVAIEGIAARLAAERIDEPTLFRLTEIAAQMEAVDPADADTFLFLNREFHDVLYRRSGRTLLCDFVLGLQDKSLRYRRAFLDLKPARERMLRQRKLLLSALRRRDTEAVEGLVRDNLLQNSQLLAREMRKNRVADHAPCAKAPVRRKSVS